MENKTVNIYVLLPAYNEEESLPLVLPKIKNVLEGAGGNYRIIVLNDGSRDRTAQVLESLKNEYPLDILTHSMNRGLGETERDLFEYAAAQCGSNDYMVRFDCDDTHEPEYILKLLEKVKQGYDVVNTSRFQPGGGQKGVVAYRAFISRGANIFMRLVFNVPGLRDYSCGYRIYRAEVVKKAVEVFGNNFIQLKGLGFTSTLEMVVKLKLLGCRFAEIPFVLRYDQKAGKSKMVTSVTTLGYLIMALLYHWPFAGWKSQAGKRRKLGQGEGRGA